MDENRDKNADAVASAGELDSLRNFAALGFLILGVFLALVPAIVAAHAFLTARTTLDQIAAIELLDTHAYWLIGVVALAFAVPLAPSRSQSRKLNAAIFVITVVALSLLSVKWGLFVFFVGSFFISIGLFLTPPAQVFLLLAVVVLIGLAWPSIFSEPTRASVARIRSDQRAMATALEAYYLEYNDYPESTSDPARKALWDSPVALPTFARSLFTTGTLPENSEPVQLLLDPLRLLSERRTFAYYLPPDHIGWILFSPGPDSEFDVTSESLPRLYDPHDRNPLPALLELTYDPTNGSRSRGDVYRFKE